MHSAVELSARWTGNFFNAQSPGFIRVGTFHYPHTFPVSSMYLETRDKIMPEMNEAIQMYAFGKYAFSVAPLRTHALLSASLCAVHVP